ncbi:response regulator transcription factor [Chamaesiphon polymorphus]|uniref:DNA-binding response regulator n=1 Tax=Chamaesiphon polymorphus CCALA 037 TaxID=2107692 RepID=A0A2T1F5N2_9CYAN|nr:response regulator transcription factor [Chamaesiphon polymorphus]PSB40279.1 DNA-binding response regulator [Chamaesiphon polymorphus CCALA 037]
MIRLFLVEDQAIVRDGLKIMLETTSDFQMVGEAENGVEAIDRLQELQDSDRFPDVVLMDVRMPEMDGVEATQHLCQTYPDLKVLILTTFDDSEYVRQALQNGAKGYLLKDTPIAELAKAIRSIFQGYTQFGPGLIEKALAQSDPVTEIETEPPAELLALTDREREVLKLIAEGLSNREIAEALFLSEGTVRNHVSNVLLRLNVRDRTQAVILANTFPTYLNPIDTLTEE